MQFLDRARKTVGLVAREVALPAESILGVLSARGVGAEPRQLLVRVAADELHVGPVRLLGLLKKLGMTIVELPGEGGVAGGLRGGKNPPVGVGLGERVQLGAGDGELCLEFLALRAQLTGLVLARG